VRVDIEGEKEVVQIETTMENTAKYLNVKERYLVKKKGKRNIEKLID
jgi:hypothetical protein